MHAAIPWTREPCSSWRTSSCATAQSTTSTRTGSTASPSSSAPQGAPLRRPSLRLALRQLHATYLTEHLHHLWPKTAPWREDTRPRGATRRAKHPRVKKEAVKKFLDRKRMLHHSSHHRARITCCGKAPHCLSWRCVSTKTKLHLQSGPRRPRPAAVPSPLNYVASPGQASSSRICLLATTAPPTPRSSCSSMS